MPLQMVDDPFFDLAINLVAWDVLWLRGNLAQ